MFSLFAGNKATAGSAAPAYSMDVLVSQPGQQLNSVVLGPDDNTLSGVLRIVNSDKAKRALSTTHLNILLFVGQGPLPPPEGGQQRFGPAASSPTSQFDPEAVHAAGQVHRRPLIKRHRMLWSPNNPGEVPPGTNDFQFTLDIDPSGPPSITDPTANSSEQDITYVIYAFLRFGDQQEPIIARRDLTVRRGIQWREPQRISLDGTVIENSVNYKLQVPDVIYAGDPTGFISVTVPGPTTYQQLKSMQCTWVEVVTYEEAGKPPITREHILARVLRGADTLPQNSTELFIRFDVPPGVDVSPDCDHRAVSPDVHPLLRAYGGAAQIMHQVRIKFEYRRQGVATPLIDGIMTNIPFACAGPRYNQQQQNSQGFQSNGLVPSTPSQRNQIQPGSGAEQRGSIDDGTSPNGQKVTSSPGSLPGYVPTGGVVVSSSSPLYGKQAPNGGLPINPSPYEGNISFSSVVYTEDFPENESAPDGQRVRGSVVVVGNPSIAPALPMEENVVEEDEPATLDHLVGIQKAASQAYEAQAEDEISISVGDTLFIRKAWVDGFAYGMNLTTFEEGMFPQTCLFGDGSSNAISVTVGAPENLTEDTSSALKDSYNSSAPVAAPAAAIPEFSRKHLALNQHIPIHPHISRAPEELDVELSDIISLDEVFENEWGFGVSENTGKSGWYPLVILGPDFGGPPGGMPIPVPTVPAPPIPTHPPGSTGAAISDDGAATPAEPLVFKDEDDFELLDPALNIVPVQNLQAPPRQAPPRSAVPLTSPSVAPASGREAAYKGNKNFISGPEVVVLISSAAEAGATLNGLLMRGRISVVEYVKLRDFVEDLEALNGLLSEGKVTVEEFIKARGRIYRGACGFR